MSSSDNKDEEWGRITANPDNMIVSDALRGMLAETDFDSEGNTPDTFLQCTVFGSEDTIISGRTAKFQQTENMWEVSFECAHSTANTMLTFGDVTSVLFSVPGSESEVVWEVQENTKITKLTEFFSQNDALVTITCVKEAKDPNSYTVLVENTNE